MGANDPIRVGTTPMSDALVAALTRMVGLSLANRSSGSILSDPTIMSGFENWAAFGALGSKAIDVDWGTEVMSQTNEGTDLTVLTLDDDDSTLTAARFGFARQLADRARLYDAWSITDWMNFARDAQWGWEATVVDQIAALYSSITATGGNAGGAATWNTILNDLGTLKIAYAAGPYVLITRPKDWQNLSKDALTLGGAIQMDPETRQYMQMAGYGFEGVFYNGQLAVYTTDKLDANGGNTYSLLFGRQFLRWTSSSYPAVPGERLIMRTPTWQSKFEEDVLKSESKIANTSEIGVAIRANAAGIKLPFLT